MPNSSLEKLYELSVEENSLFKQIADDCAHEVARRLHEHPEKVEDVQLFRLLSECNRVIMAMAKTDKPVQREPPDLAELTFRLPPERRAGVIDLLTEGEEDGETDRS